VQRQVLQKNSASDGSNSTTNDETSTGIEIEDDPDADSYHS
jgi:hypothetical protein